MDAIFSHRSIRVYREQPIESEKMSRMLEAATRASTTGNMQLYSIVVTTSPDLKKALAPAHFNQSMVTGAPAVVTFCADINRFSKWCRLRDAEPCYDNFAWFVNSAIDTLLAAQNFCLQAETEGLGICYLGTTTYNAQEIAAVLNLPKGVIPITTVTIGYPAQNPPLTDRLPVEAVVHYDTYKDYSEADINRLWKEKESLEFTKQLLKENNLDNLAKIFTQNRYKAEDNLFFSKKYFDALVEQGFFNQ